MKKKGNIDNWMEETIDKAIQAGKLYELLFSDEGKQLTKGYPKSKLHKFVLKSLGRIK